jgi:hypothetical protein
MSDVINEVGFSGQEVGNDMSDDVFGEKELIESEPEIKKEKDTQTPNGENENAEEKITEENGKTNGKDDDKKSNNAPKLSDFASNRFLKKSDDGSSTFDADTALGFLQPKNKDALAFKYEPKTKAPEKKDQKQPEQPEESNPYKRRIAEKREYEKSMQERAYLWPNKYSEAIKAGYSADQAVQYAHAQVKTWHEEQVADWQYKKEQEEAENRGKSELTTRENEQLREKAVINEQLYINHFGNRKEYDTFMFGQIGNDGKLKKGYATDFIYKQFEIMNPEKVSPNANDYTAWWNKFASEPSNLAMAYEFGMARLLVETLPHLIQKGAEVRAENTRQNNMAQRRPNRGQGAVSGGGKSEMTDALTGFFQSPGERGQIDTI